MSGIACEEDLMKDQRDLEVAEVYVLRKDGCHLSSLQRLF